MSWVGNERYLIERQLIRDPESGRMVREAFLHPGRDIYFWWTRKYHHCKDGSMSVYKHFHFSMGGKKQSYYCPNGEAFPDEFFSVYYHLVLNYSLLLSNWRNFYRSQKVKKMKRKNGRPLAFAKEVYDLLDAAGFGTNGSEVVVKYKKFLTLESAAFRFSLLTEQDQKTIGTPESLRDLCKKGYSLLKSRNRLSIPTTYEQCFHDVVTETLEI